MSRTRQGNHDKADDDIEEAQDLNESQEDDDQRYIELERRPPKNKRKFRLLANEYLAVFLAETVGTLIFVFILDSAMAQVMAGRRLVGSTVVGDSVQMNPADIDYLLYGDFTTWALAYGMGYGLGMVVSRPASGGHMNPCITVSMAVLKRVKWALVPLYIVGQCTGAFVAAALTFVIHMDSINRMGGSKNFKLAKIFATYPTIESTGYFALIIDQLLRSLFFSFIFFGFCDPKKRSQSDISVSIFVGTALTVLAMATGIETGGLCNPAADFVPRIFSLTIGYGTQVFTAGQYYFWIPLVVPFVGALLGALLYLGTMEWHIPDLDQANDIEDIGSEEDLLQKFVRPLQVTKTTDLNLPPFLQREKLKQKSLPKDNSSSSQVQKLMQKRSYTTNSGTVIFIPKDSQDFTRMVAKQQTTDTFKRTDKPYYTMKGQVDIKGGEQKVKGKKDKFFDNLRSKILKSKENLPKTRKLKKREEDQVKRRLKRVLKGTKSVPKEHLGAAKSRGRSKILQESTEEKETKSSSTKGEEKRQQDSATKSDETLPTAEFSGKSDNSEEIDEDDETLPTAEFSGKSEEIDEDDETLPTTAQSSNESDTSEEMDEETESSSEASFVKKSKSDSS